MNRDDLEALREGWDFELKLGLGCDGLGAVPESLWETYSAMANTTIRGGSRYPHLAARSDESRLGSDESSDESRLGSDESLFKLPGKWGRTPRPRAPAFARLLRGSA